MELMGLQIEIAHTGSGDLNKETCQTSALDHTGTGPPSLTTDGIYTLETIDPRLINYSTSTTK